MKQNPVHRHTDCPAKGDMGSARPLYIKSGENADCVFAASRSDTGRASECAARNLRFSKNSVEFFEQFEIDALFSDLDDFHLDAVADVENVLDLVDALV